MGFLSILVLRFLLFELALFLDQRRVTDDEIGTKQVCLIVSLICQQVGHVHLVFLNDDYINPN